MEAQAAGGAEPAAGAAAVAGAERAGGVLDQRQVGQLLEARGPAEQVHRHDRLRPRRDLDLRGVDVVRRRVDVDEDGRGAGERNDVRGRGKRVGGDDHLVARPDPEREHGEVERGGARRDRDGVLDLAGGGEAGLELGDLRRPSSASRSPAPRRPRPPRRRRCRARLDGCRGLRPVPRDRLLEALVEIDLRLEAEQLPGLFDVGHPDLDVRVVERLEGDLAGTAAERA